MALGSQYNDDAAEAAERARAAAEEARGYEIGSKRRASEKRTEAAHNTQRAKGADSELNVDKLIDDAKHQLHETIHDTGTVIGKLKAAAGKIGQGWEDANAQAASLMRGVRMSKDEHETMSDFVRRARIVSEAKAATLGSAESVINAESLSPGDLLRAEEILYGTYDEEQLATLARQINPDFDKARDIIEAPRPVRLNRYRQFVLDHLNPDRRAASARAQQRKRIADDVVQPASYQGKLQLALQDFVDNMNRFRPEYQDLSEAKRLYNEANEIIYMGRVGYAAGSATYDPLRVNKTIDYAIAREALDRGEEVDLPFVNLRTAEEWRALAEKYPEVGMALNRFDDVSFVGGVAGREGEQQFGIVRGVVNMDQERLEEMLRTGPLAYRETVSLDVEKRVEKALGNSAAESLLTRSQKNRLYDQANQVLAGRVAQVMREADVINGTMDDEELDRLADALAAAFHEDAGGIATHYAGITEVGSHLNVAEGLENLTPEQREARIAQEMASGAIHDKFMVPLKDTARTAGGAGDDGLDLRFARAVTREDISVGDVGDLRGLLDEIKTHQGLLDRTRRGLEGNNIGFDVYELRQNAAVNGLWLRGRANALGKGHPLYQQLVDMSNEYLQLSGKVRGVQYQTRGTRRVATRLLFSDEFDGDRVFLSRVSNQTVDNTALLRMVATEMLDDETKIALMSPEQLGKYTQAQVDELLKISRRRGQGKAEVDAVQYVHGVKDNTQSRYLHEAFQTAKETDKSAYGSIDELLRAAERGEDDVIDQATAVFKRASAAQLRDSIAEGSGASLDEVVQLMFYKYFPKEIQPYLLSAHRGERDTIVGTWSNNLVRLLLGKEKKFAPYQAVAYDGPNATFVLKAAKALRILKESDQEYVLPALPLEARDNHLTGVRLLGKYIHKAGQKLGDTMQESMSEFVESTAFKNSGFAWLEDVVSEWGEVAGSARKTVNEVKGAFAVSHDIGALDIEKIAKGSRWAGLGVVAGVIAFKLGTEYMKQKAYDEAWDRDANEEWTSADERLRAQQMQQVAMQGNLTLESSYRRSNHHNMRPDKHKHLFRG